MYRLSDPSSEQKVLFGLFWRFLLKLSRFCIRGATLWSGNSILSSRNLTYNHLMKINWLIAYQCNSYRVPLKLSEQKVIVGLFCGVFVVKITSPPPQLGLRWWSIREPFCGLETPSWALKTLLCVCSQPNTWVSDLFYTQKLRQKQKSCHVTVCRLVCFI